MPGLAVVTGGTRGIGYAISEALSEAGYSVAAVYHSDEDSAETFRKTISGGAYKWDVCDFQACAKGIANIEEELGPVNILVNNAGITRDSTLHKMAYDQWQTVIETNLYSCFNMCRAVIEGMRERAFGRIINISSVNGQKGQFGQTNYAAAKAGILGFTKSLALESAAKGITVNAICPGYVETSMTEGMRKEVLDNIIRQIPVARMGEPSEIANIVKFLASEEAAFITGTTVSANGGQYMA